VSTLPRKTYRTRFVAVYITYFSIGLQVVDFWHQIFTNCWNNSFQQSTTLSVVFTDIHYIFFASDAYNIWHDCFQCSLTLSVTCSRCEAL